MSKSTVHVMIDLYERYPTYEIRVPGDASDGEIFPVRPNIEMPEADVAEWQRVVAEYDAWQEKLQGLMEEIAARRARRQAPRLRGAGAEEEVLRDSGTKVPPRSAVAPFCRGR